MGKKPRTKATVQIQPEYAIPTESPVQNKKKHKNAPDRPQPEWMFPPDEDNPVLNPKPKPEAQRKHEEAARDQAIKFLQYKSVTAPDKAPPPDILLTLVGAFLTAYGFNSTSRIYSTQLQSRKKLDAWKIQLNAKLPEGFPNLVKIYEEWYKTYKKRTRMEERSSGSGSDVSSGARETKVSKKARKQAKAGARAKGEAVAKVIAKDETSSSGGTDSSDDESESDVEMENAALATGSIKKNRQASKSKPPSQSTSSSSSDSDADDEEEPDDMQLPTPATLQDPIANGAGKSLKRKASSSGTSSSNSSSDSAELSANEATAPTLTKARNKADTKSATIISEYPASGAFPTSFADPSSSSDTSSSNSESAVEAPKAATTIKMATPDSSSSFETSSSESDSEVDFSKPPERTPTIRNTKSSLKPTSSDSSATLQAPSTANTNLSSTSATTSSSDSANAPTAKRKRSLSPKMPAFKQQKSQNTPFQRVPKDTPVDPKFASNAYRSYDYAERAHQDLSVTKGKGFTKEKNKKKRGSYRGGAIDVTGGKGIKFED
ncbi:hypothetical protein N7G274_006253 [Stereocaulon virgatum]|uniref:Srp40 C-terminal domain-containing protein n=1 Tax=Stereocaulon virgatum TaxID=373712 RepID=A0ABR4A5S3_9LECA